jgi:phenylalanyl-tRNA synthetase beta chain
MRVPLSWLREYVDLPATETGRDVQAKLVSAGLEVERVEQLGADLKGPLVVGKVLTIEELEGFKKPIRFCTVDVGTANGTGEPQEIVCGARNFAVGDKVVVVLPGAVLPGNFAIAARKTYGKTSHGMICSGDELGMGDDGSGGIIVLPPEHEVGTDAVELLELVDEVLDIAVTPDRGYALSMRGVAREAATAYGLPLRDPALLDVPGPNAFGYPVQVSDPQGCDRFTARTVTGLSPEAHSPIWLRRRLQKAGMRPISLAVDITNYVMLELGQPLHAYDRSRVQGTIGVRRAEPGEKLTTLDGAKRTLDAEDLVITDDRGPIGLAGVMGGANTEIDDTEGTTTEVVVEAAHFDPISIARTARRHKLASEASKRFERGVDPEATSAAAQRTVDLLVLLAGGTADGGVTEVIAPSAPRTISIPANHPDKVAGVDYGRETVVRRLQQVGCDVYGQDELIVTVPSWRPDLTDPNDLAEEVIRLEGYENLPSTLPKPPAGLGLTDRQRLHRRVGRALAGAGYVEALNYPFIGEHVFDQLGLAADDPKRKVVKLVNPLSDEEPALRTTLLPGLLRPCAATTGGARTTWRSSRRAWSSTRRTSCAWRCGCPSTAVPRTRRSRPSPTRCPSSPGMPPSSSRAPVSRPAGGARAARPTGPTPSSPRAPSPARRGPNSSCARASTGRGTRAAAPSSPSSSTAPSGSSGTRASCTPVSSRPLGCPRAPVRWS